MIGGRGFTQAGNYHAHHAPGAGLPLPSCTGGEACLLRRVLASGLQPPACTGIAVRCAGILVPVLRAGRSERAAGGEKPAEGDAPSAKRPRDPTHYGPIPGSVLPTWGGGFLTRFRPWPPRNFPPPTGMSALVRNCPHNPPPITLSLARPQLSSACLWSKMSERSSPIRLDLSSLRGAPQDVLHLLPCEVEHNGSAPVDRYFTPAIRQGLQGW
ncbi:hypothetical protein KIL84_002723 [Mauremys mutica]|uniref:Uncharacterized protein n=1 Tax=Mauremys mutica TaxID=74926 RepID=A0A9D3WUD7_9SAUR|nr:hypothetical protein KIL84_002723 [Mauremys mutica]